MTKDILNFCAEAGLLKRVKRSGWWVLNIPQEESVADHSFRCAIIGYFLAKMEEADPHKTVMMCLLNDMHEARITDLHKIAQMYIDGKSAETDAFMDQINTLPAALRDELGAFHLEYGAQTSISALLARDADILECLMQAKEYVDTGLTAAEKFLTKMPALLTTKSAKKLWAAMKTWDSAEWWAHLGKFER